MPHLLATYVHALNPFVIRFTESFGIRWYGLCYVLSFLIGYWLYVRLAKQGYSELPAAKVGDFITMTALFGVIVGGRLGHVLFYGLEDYLRDPIQIFYLNRGGMSSHGGIIGIIFFTWFYARWQKISWTNLGDNLVVVSPVGLLLVRMANFINGELYGRVTDVAWAMKFPRELADAANCSPAALERYPSAAQRFDLVDAAYQSDQVRASIADVLQLRHPSQLYEAFFEGVVLLSILWILRTRFRLPNGVLTGAFFIIYAIFRIGCEYFREPDSAMVGIFTKGQFLSLFMFLIGGAFVWWGFSTRHYAPCLRPAKAI